MPSMKRRNGVSTPSFWILWSWSLFFMKSVLLIKALNDGTLRMATFGHSCKDDVMWFGGFLVWLSGFYSCVSLRFLL